MTQKSNQKACQGQIGKVFHASPRDDIRHRLPSATRTHTKLRFLLRELGKCSQKFFEAIPGHTLMLTR